MILQMELGSTEEALIVPRNVPSDDSIDAPINAENTPISACAPNGPEPDVPPLPPEEPPPEEGLVVGETGTDVAVGGGVVGVGGTEVAVGGTEVAVGASGVGVAVGGTGVGVDRGLGVGVGLGAGGRETTTALTGSPHEIEPTGARDE
jgi:hypothetical protein